MTSPTTQFAPSGRIGIYEPLYSLGIWNDGAFNGNIGAGPSAVCIGKPEDKMEYNSDRSVEHAEESPTSKTISEKIQRRLAQNRAAAKKSRLRKKAYVQQLESSRLKLAQLEIELERSRQQRLLVVGATPNVGVYSSIAAFEMEYGQWVEEQDRKINELRNFLQLANIGDADLRLIVESLLQHYYHLFRMKRDVAKVDAFYLWSGVWKTSIERFCLWIGGFRPSELITVVFPKLEPLREHQNRSIEKLRHSCIQAEDALSQGMEKLQALIDHSVKCHVPGSIDQGSQTALESLGSLEGFINQADHLREQSLHRMSCILDTRQAAKGLLAFGEHFQRLRSLSSIWSAHCNRAGPVSY